MALKSGYYGVKKGLLNKLQKLTGIYSLDSETLELSSAGELKVIGGSGGTTVEGNPQDEATDSLSKIKIGETVYDVPDTTYSEGTGVDISAQNVISLDAGIDDLNDVVITNPQDGQILQYDAASQKWVNHINAPEYITVNVDVYSAASDTLTYTDETGQKTVTTDASGHGQATITCINGYSITFISSVAKDPSDLSANYSKTVNITSSTTAVYVMPDNAIYWYGYESNNFEIVNTTNGWSINNNYALNNPTKQTNRYYCENGSALGASLIGSKNAISNISKYKMIYDVPSQTSPYIHYGAFSSKNIDSAAFGYESTTGLHYKEVTNSVSGNKYLVAGAIGGERSDYMYALWYE